jgi:hypothetical protein
MVEITMTFEVTGVVALVVTGKAVVDEHPSLLHSPSTRLILSRPPGLMTSFTPGFRVIERTVSLLATVKTVTLLLLAARTMTSVLHAAVLLSQLQVALKRPDALFQTDMPARKYDQGTSVECQDEASR